MSMALISFLEARKAKQIASRSVVSGAPGRNICLLGDSRSDLNTTPSLTTTSATKRAFRNIGYMVWADILSGGRVRWQPEDNLGWFGQDTGQILARVGDVIARRPAICVVHAGTNDPYNGLTIAQTLVNVQAIIDALLGAGIGVIFLSETPRQADGSSAVLNKARLDAFVRQQAITRPGLVWVNVRPGFDDGATGAQAAGVTYDGTHYSPSGAFAVGANVAEAIKVLLPPLDTLFANGADLYHATDNPTGNLLVNGLLTGTGGAAGTGGATGSIAASWTSTLGTANAALGGTKLASKVASTDGIGEWQQIALSGVTGGTQGENFALQQTVLLSSGKYAPGDVVEALCEIDMDASAHVVGATLRLTENNGASSFEAYACDSYSFSVKNPNRAYRGVLRTPTVQVRGTSGGTPQLIVRPTLIVDSTVSGGATATMRVRRISLRKVV